MVIHGVRQRQPECHKRARRQTRDLGQLLPTKTGPDRQSFDSNRQGVRQFIDPPDALFLSKNQQCQCFGLGVELVTRLLKSASIFSSRRSIAADRSLTKASFEDKRLLSSIRTRYSTIRFATISISASLNGLVR